MIWVFVVVGLIILLIAALIFCIAPGRWTPDAKKTAQAFYGLNCAHRGLHTKDQQVPENSLRAFAAARDANYGVELDVRLTKDGKVVVFHDNGLKRACGIDALVSSKSWDELSSLPLFGTEEKIPLLSEALEVLGQTPMIVELKTAGDDNRKLCEETLKIMRTYKGNWCMESFDPRICRWFRKKTPDVLRGQLNCLPREYSGLSKISTIILGNMLTNFMSRPHFISCSNSPHTLTVRLCRAMKPMTVVWVVLPDHEIALCEKENDTIIFEYYDPPPKYRP